LLGGADVKIVVLCGGLSPERNVSLSSGAKVAGALMERGHSVVLVDMFFGLENWRGDLAGIFDNPPPLGGTKIDEQAPDLAQIRASRKLKSPSQFGDRVLEVCQMADIVFLALHGQCGEDGRVQAAFDLMGIRYTGSGYLGSAIAMDKDLTKRIVTPFGVRTPDWRVYDCAEINIPAVVSDMELPCVIKPVDSGSSIGVFIARTKEELQAALEASAITESRVVVERYVEGREIQIGILDGKALPSIEIRPREGFYDYKNKYQPGAAEEITPSPIPEEAEARLANSALTVYQALGLSAYSRADYIYDHAGRFWFLEINTLPGMTPTSLVPQEAAVVGISYAELCDKIVEVSLEKYQ
jgi:D-alanine-D-alanine ligase